MDMRTPEQIKNFQAWMKGVRQDSHLQCKLLYERYTHMNDDGKKFGETFCFVGYYMYKVAKLKKLPSLNPKEYVSQETGVSRHLISEAMHKNDGGMSFPDIADWLEEQMENWNMRES